MKKKRDLRTATFPNFSQNFISLLPCGFGLSGWVFSHPAAFPKRSFPPPTVDPSSWATGWNAPWLGGDRSICNHSTFSKVDLNIWSSTLGCQRQQYETRHNWNEDAYFTISPLMGFSSVAMLVVPLLVLYDQGVAIWVGSINTNCPPTPYIMRLGFPGWIFIFPSFTSRLVSGLGPGAAEVLDLRAIFEGKWWLLMGTQ